MQDQFENIIEEILSKITLNILMKNDWKKCYKNLCCCEHRKMILMSKM